MANSVCATNRQGCLFAGFKLLSLVLALVGLTACQSLGYYSQSVVGHSRLMLARTSIDQALEHADEGVAHKLRLSTQLKAFASAELSLPDSQSYSTYVPLKRPYPVWVVVAAPEFSLEPKQWCYPVIGCAAYRGYFSEHSANRYAEKLQQKGWQTHVSGAAAYSTLGWFSDPLLPSMMSGNDTAFAEALFHELAHQQLYIKGNSGLNEAFASLVGEKGVIKWLQHQDLHNQQLGKEGRNDLDAYLSVIKARNEFSQLLERHKTQLGALYAENISAAEKHQQRAVLTEAFRKKYLALKQNSWQGRGYYDYWLLSPINNARLAAFSTYHDLLPKLERLYQACDANLERFYHQLEKDQKINEPPACS